MKIETLRIMACPIIHSSKFKAGEAFECLDARCPEEMAQSVSKYGIESNFQVDIVERRQFDTTIV